MSNSVSFDSVNSKIFSNVKSIENVSIAPGKVLGRLLDTGFSVDLLIELTTIIFDVRPKSSHDRVTSSSGGGHVITGGGSLNKIEEVHPLTILFSGKREIVSVVLKHILFHGNSSFIEAFCEDSSEELPRVATGVVISSVSSVEDEELQHRCHAG